jgi:hypothetical protein
MILLSFSHIRREGRDGVVDHRLPQRIGQEGIVLKDGDRGRRALQAAARRIVAKRLVLAPDILGEGRESVGELIVGVGENAVALEVREDRLDLGGEILAAAASRDRMA